MISSDITYPVYLLETQRQDEQRKINSSESRVANLRQEIQREETFQHQARVHIRALNDAISNLQAQGNEASNGND